ncbi:putative porin [Acinetobacter sp. ANC 4470]|uniref:putative porin n=1 Tax=Acinetobacter sp. ANC 4470 TaxID=1977881 RepID=UPI000A343A8D|nr:putative porin [Acinetobacter sp. ANC 4470]OTG69484.1 putative porin [Acinetobacter sp. ANC 4470]
MKRSLLALGLAAIASSSFAYNAQVDGGFSYFDNDDNITDSEGQFDLKGTFYFDSVSTKNTPLNEAAFLGHNSNAYAQYSYNYLESKELEVLDGRFSGELNAHHLTGGVEYFVEQFYLNGEIGFGQVEDKLKLTTPLGSESYSENSDVMTYRALVGYMPLSNLLLAAGIDGFQGDHDLEDNRFAVRAKYVAPLAQGQFINLEADGTFGDTDSVTVAVDYYFDHAFSLGAAYNIEDNGEDDADFFSIRSKYFINSNFSVGGAVGFGDDVQAFNINATYRF